MTISNVDLYGSEPFSHAPIFAGVAFFGFIASVVFIIMGQRLSKKHHQTISQILLALWVLGPPLWFFYEHFYYFPAHGNFARGATFEQLKAAQEVTAKVWAAFAVVLGALYNKEFSNVGSSE